MDTHPERDPFGGADAHGIALPDTALAEALRSMTRYELSERDLSVRCVEGVLDRDVLYPAAGPPAFSITLTLKGRGRANIDGVEPIEIAAGSATVFWSNQPVSGLDQVDGGIPIEAIEIRFPPHLLPELIGSSVDAYRSALLVDRSDPSRRTILVGFPLSAPLADVAKSIVGCRLEPGRTRALYMRGKALEALALTVDALSRLSRRAPRLSPPDKERIAQARRLIENALDDAWTTPALAAAVGLSESKLKAGFKVLVGKSVRSYLRQLRIDRACSLIEQGHTVTASALAAGFHSLSHFSKTFREVKGVYPRDFSRIATEGDAGDTAKRRGRT
ncbi:MAG TPA: AraC family transcriptional regulator [Hyphomicrobium sp.]|nr:AraC family transcriptional regulator [Hyphomicrobium sp.]